MRRRFVLGAVAIAILGGLALLWRRADEPAPIVTVTLPPLTAAAEEGAELFAANCASCHGPDGGGSDEGPPLIHAIYRPGHHADAAFYLAALRGVRAHHWRFGDMPPVEDVSEDEVGAIIVFVRAIQRANGID